MRGRAGSHAEDKEGRDVSRDLIDEEGATCASSSADFGHLLYSTDFESFFAGSIEGQDDWCTGAQGVLSGFPGMNNCVYSDDGSSDGDSIFWGTNLSQAWAYGNAKPFSPALSAEMAPRHSFSNELAQNQRQLVANRQSTRPTR